jgi:hypothetical protein
MIRMTMDCCPTGKSAQGISILKNQVISNGQDLTITLGKTCHQVFRNPRVLSDAVKEVGGTIETPCCPCARHRPSFGFIPDDRLRFLSVRNDLLCLGIQLPDAFALRPRLLLILISIRNRFVRVGDSRFFIGLVDDSWHRRSLLSLQYIYCNDD